MKKIFLFIFSLICFTSLLSSQKQGNQYGYTAPPPFDVPQYDPATDNQLLFPVKVNNLYGYINERGEIVIKPQYDIAYDFEDGIAHVMFKSDYDVTGGFIDIHNNIIWKDHDDFYTSGYFNDGLAFVNRYTEEGFKTGYINRNGKLVIPAFFDKGWDFSSGMARVAMYVPPIPKDSAIFIKKKDQEKRTRWGYINTKGELTVPFEYNDANDFSEGYGVVMKTVDNKKLYGLVDQNGKLVIPVEYDELGQFREGLISAEKDDKEGYIDVNNQWVITLPGGFMAAGDFYNGMAQVYNGEKYGYIDHSGKLIIPAKFESCGDFLSEFTYIYEDEHYGLINRKGDIIIAAKDGGESIVWFDGDPLCAAEKNGLIGFIDTTGNWIIPPKFDNAQNFKNGLAAVIINGSYWHPTAQTQLGYINTKGEFVWPLTK